MKLIELSNEWGDTIAVNTKYISSIEKFTVDGKTVTQVWVMDRAYNVTIAYEDLMRLLVEGKVN